MSSFYLLPHPNNSSYYIDMDSFDEPFIGGRRVKRLLETEGWKISLSIKENVYC